MTLLFLQQNEQRQKKQGVGSEELYICRATQQRMFAVQAFEQKKKRGENLLFCRESTNKPTTIHAALCCAVQYKRLRTTRAMNDLTQARRNESVQRRLGGT